MSKNAPLPRQARLLSSCAAAVIATLTLHMPIRAQSVSLAPGGFQGTAVPVVNGTTPTATVNQSGTNTLVTVNAPRAIINWTPNDNRTGTSEAIDFLPVGRTADFVNTSNRFGQDYIVLNRILPADANRTVAFNGQVRSTLSSAAGGAKGGQVWFYSPGGILVGATGSFDVGSLLLTSNAVTDADVLDTSNTSFSFAAASGSRAAIEIQGTINAASRNAYVALIAPRVVQSGNVTVNGTAAYVAAEKVDMTISGSLFNIAVPADGGSSFGGSSANDAALVHTGNTTLTNQESGYGAPDQGQDPQSRAAIMVAVPKNDAVTMLVQGNVLYTQATEVARANGKIILSGGNNVRLESGSGASFPGDPAGAPGKANLIVAGGNFGTAGSNPLGSAMDTEIVATGDAIVRTDSGAIAFGGDLDVEGTTSSIIEATGGRRIDVADTVYMSAFGTENRAAGLVRVAAVGAGSTVDIKRGLDLYAETYASNGSGGNAINTGLAEIEANAGSISVGGDVVVFASGYGGRGTSAGGNAEGGTARISSSNGGQITLQGDAIVEASGFGGVGAQAGSGTGGAASITADGGNINISGDADVIADGRAENGYGSTGTRGGSGFGGTSTVEATDGSIIVGGDIAIEADARGGFGDLSSGSAEGGDTLLSANAGGAIRGSTYLEMSAVASGGFSGTGRGSDATGGSATIVATGTVEIGYGSYVDVSASASGGNGGGGNAQGGTVDISAAAGGSFEAGALYGEIVAEGDGGSGSSTGSGGTGKGGTVNLTTNGGTLDFAGGLDVDARGRGGSGFDGGDGTGGTIALTANGGGIVSGGSIFAEAEGQGGGSFDSGYGAGTYGTGQGGTISLTVNPVGGVTGQVSAEGQITLGASGFGGNVFGSERLSLMAAAGEPSLNGGDGFGGRVTVDVDGRLATSALRLLATGEGGDGNSDFSGETPGDAGSNGGGGTVTAIFRGGTNAIGAYRSDVSGIGGDGGSGSTAGNGGIGTGGTTSLTVAGGTVAADSIDLQSNGRGGNDGSQFDEGPQTSVGGAGTGGGATLAATGGTLTVSGSADVHARGRGGAGFAKGGTSEGGAAIIRASGSGSIDVAFDAEADASGGSEGSFSVGASQIKGGDTFGGKATVEAVSGGKLEFGSLSVEAFGYGTLGQREGGDAEGGIASLFARGGTIGVTETLLVGASGFGGITFNGDVGYGSGTGGLAQLEVSGIGGRVGAGSIVLEAVGLGGRGFFGEEALFAAAQNESGGAAGGFGKGGSATALVDGELATNRLELLALGIGGDGRSSFDPLTVRPGSDGTGGTASIEFRSGTTSIATLILDAYGEGGNGGSNVSGNGGDGAAGGAGTGGKATILSTGGVATVGRLEMNAYGSGGRGGNGSRNNGNANGGLGGSGGVGGAGSGGIITIAAGNTGALTIPADIFDANGFGGRGGAGGGGTTGGAGGAGGAAKGGSVNISAENAGLSIFSNADDGYGNTLAETAFFETRSIGGAGGTGGGGDTAGVGGRGGNARGGAITVDLAGTGTLGQTMTGIQLANSTIGGAGGNGGSGLSNPAVSGAGGTATGGGIRLQLDAASADLTSIALDVQATGGAGGFGIEAGYGDAGYGGIAAVGGAGGNATGGGITIASVRGTTTLAANSQLQALGVGGAGGDSVDRAGGAGGSGTGGNILLDIGGTGQLVASGLTLAAVGGGGTGGSGGDDAVGGNGGRGGDGFGGNTEARTFGSGKITSTAGRSAGLTINVSGVGADGGTAGNGSDTGNSGGRGGDGGNGTGGNGNVAALGGSVTTAGLTIDADGEGGDASIGGFGPEEVQAAGGIGGNGLGGTIAITVADAEAGPAGALSAGDTTLLASGFGGTGDAFGSGSAGFVAIRESAKAASGSLQFGNLTARAQGLGDVNELGFLLVTDTGRVDIAGNASIATDLSASISGMGGAGIVATGNFVVNAGGSISLDQDAGATTALIRAANVSLFAGGSILGGGANLSARDDIDANATSDTALGSLFAGEDINATGATVTIRRAVTDGSGTSDGEEGPGSNLTVNATGAIAVGDADIAAEIQLRSELGTITSSGTLKAGGSILAEAQGDIRLVSATAGEEIEVVSFAGDISSSGTLTAGGTIIVDAEDGDVALTNAAAGGSLFISGNAVALTGFGTAGDRISVSGSSVALGDLTTTRRGSGSENSNGIVVSSGGLATIRSANSAARIGVTSQSFSGGPLTAGTSVIVEAFGNSGFDGSIRVGDVKAGSFAELAGRGSVTATGIDAATNATVRSQAGGVSVGTGRAGRDFTVQASGNIVVTSAQAGDDVRVTSSNGAVAVANAITTGLGQDTESGYGSGSGSNIFIQAREDARLDNGTTPGAITLGSSTGSVRSAGLLQARRLLTSQEFDIALTDVNVTESLFLNADGGSITGRNFTSGRDIDLTASGGITLAGATAARDIELAATGAISVGAAQAGDDFVAESGSGSFAGGTITTTGLGEDLSESGYGSGDGSNIIVDAASTIRLDNGSAPDRISLTARGGGIDSAGLIATTRFEANATANIALTDVDVVNGLRLSTGGGSVTGRNFVSDGEIVLSASDAVAVTSLDSGASIDVQAAAIAIGSARAAQDVTLNASGNVSVQEARAGDDISILAGGTALVGVAAATGTGADSEGDGFNISVEAAGNVSFGSAETVGNLRLVSREGGILRLGAPGASLIEADGDVLVSSAFDLNLSAVEAGGAISLASAGAIDTGRLDAGGDLLLDAGAALSVDAAKAGGQLFARGKSIELGSVEIGGALGLSTPGALVLGTASAGSISGSGSSVTAGTLTTPGAISLSAIEGDVSVASAAAGSDIALSGKKVSLTDGTAGRDIVLAASGDIVVRSAKAGDDFDAKAGGAFTGTTVITTGLGPHTDGDNGYGTVALAAGDGSNIKVAASGAIALSTGTAKDSITLASSAGSIASDKALTAGGSILAGAATTVTLVGATAGQGIDATAGGAISGATLVAGSDLRLASGGNATLGSATAGDDIDVTASGITMIASATTTGKAPDDGGNGSSLLVSSAGGVTIQRIDSAGGVTLQAQNGAVLVSQDLKSVRAANASGRSVTLNAQGALAISSATATGGNVALTSAGNLTVDKADASADVNASSGGTLALNGAVNGTQLTLASRDIAIGSAAQVGTVQRTSAIQITANGGGSPVLIGGSGSGTGYRLDNAEFARLAARDVRISSQGEAGSMQIEALTVRGASASSPNVTGRLSFAAAGDVEMTGKLAFDNATDANSVQVSAGRTFFADAASAGIAVTNGAALSGSIDIDARSIVVASRSAAADLGSAPTIDARSDRLGVNDGATDNGGFLRANGIRLSASEKIHVQNSGANSDEPDDRAGLSVGAGGITLVTNTLTAPVEIIINGRQANPAGGEFTGEALIDEVTIVGANGAPANFAARSTVNGCIIGGVNCGVPVIGNSPFTSDRNVIEELLEEQEDGLTRPPALAFSRLIEVEQGALLGVIDEPVTGTGNDDIYLSGDSLDPACQDDRQNCVIDDPVTGSGNEDRQGNADGTPATTIERRPADGFVDAPVTGTGNETLQSGEPED